MDDLERIDLVCRFGQEAAMQFHDETCDESKKQYYSGLYMAYAAIRECVRILKKQGDEK